MDKVTWLALVVVWTACCIILTDSSCPGPQPCSYSNPCKNTRKKCLDGVCRKCDCDLTRQCRFNSTSGSVYCDCLDTPVTGKSGSLCKCSGEGKYETDHTQKTESVSYKRCNCPDIFGFAYGCSEYSNVFQLFDNRQLDIRGKSTDRFNVNSMAECQDKCEELDCNAFEWRRGGGGKKCKVFRFSNLVEERANIVRNGKYRLMMRVCNTCSPPTMSYM